jgi:hypothetical protein
MWSLSLDSANQIENIQKICVNTEHVQMFVLSPTKYYRVTIHKTR